MKLLSKVFSLSAKNGDLSFHRQRLLDFLLLATSLVSGVIYPLALIPVLRRSLYIAALVYSVFFLWQLLITFNKRLSFKFRSLSWLFFLFTFGTINLGLSGFNVDSGLFFITFITMTALLYRYEWSLVSLLISLITIILMGTRIIQGQIPLMIGLPQTDPILWLIGGMIYLLMGFAITRSVAVLINGLETSWKTSLDQTSMLEQRNKALIESEARYNTLIETIPDAVLTSSLNREILLINQAGLQLFGYNTREELDRKSIREIFIPEDFYKIEEVIQITLEKGQAKNVEVTVTRPNGTLVDVEFSTALLQDDSGAPIGIIAVGKDISDRKKAQRLLEEARNSLENLVAERTDQLMQTSERLKHLIASTPITIYSAQVEPPHPITWLSDNLRSLSGFKPEEALADPEAWRAMVNPEDLPALVRARKMVLSQGIAQCEYRVRTKDGREMWIQDISRLVYDQEGRAVEIVGSGLDITDRKFSELELKRSEEKYRSLFESMMDGYVRTDIQGRIIEFNAAYQEMLGYDRDEMYLMTYVDLTPSRWHAFEADIVENQILKRGFSEIYEKEYQKKDGKIFPVELRTVLRMNQDGIPIEMWAIVRDIEKRKQTEAALSLLTKNLENEVAQRTSQLEDSQAQLRQLTHAVIENRETENRLFSRELHDGVGQKLITLKHAFLNHPHFSEEQKVRNNKMISILDETIDMVRSISRRMRPPVLEVGGINISLEELCRECSEQTRLKIDYKGEELPGLPDDIGISLYRVVQESLSNIMKHAQASLVNVSLGYEADIIELTIEDDGVGLSGSTYIYNNGIGLLGLEERLRVLGGALDLATNSTGGTSLTARIPWHTPK